MKICFVCTGNTCRSPMAEYLMKKKLGGCENVEIFSAGVQAWPGEPASEMSIQVMADFHELDMSEHKSEKIDVRMIEQSDYIVTMTSLHKQVLIRLFPEYAEKIITLGEAADIPDIEIDDPFGGSFEDYAFIAEQISSLTSDFARKILDCSMNNFQNKEKP